MLAVCSVTVAFMARDMKGFLYTFAALAVLFFTLLVIRKPLAFSKLAKADEIYQNKAGLSFVFGEKEFRVTNSLLGDEKRFKYGEIPFLYSDSTYYYISANNEDLHMLPFADFTLGDPESFREFITRKNLFPALQGHALAMLLTPNRIYGLPLRIRFRKNTIIPLRIFSRKSMMQSIRPNLRSLV